MRPHQRSWLRRSLAEADAATTEILATSLTIHVFSTDALCVLQAADIVRLLDAKEVWVRRNKYAQLRPTGGRSEPAVKVPPRCEGLGRLGLLSDSLTYPMKLAPGNGI